MSKTQQNQQVQDCDWHHLHLTTIANSFVELDQSSTNYWEEVDIEIGGVVREAGLKTDEMLIIIIRSLRTVDDVGLCFD